MKDQFIETVCRDNNGATNMFPSYKRRRISKKMKIELAREYVSKMDHCEFMDTISRMKKLQYVILPISLYFFFPDFSPIAPVFQELKFDKLTCEWSIDGIKL